MSDKYFVDTNILMYAHDASAGAKHDRAKGVVEGLWRDRSGVLSTQVLQELCVNLQRKVGRVLDSKAVREIAADYLTWQVVINDGNSVLSALELQEKHQISFWDALVIHAAQTAGVSILYSEDLSDGQQYGGVHVQNPLKAEASQQS
jgi:predicted nucleic acid-binding protein